ncbi:MAG: site-2 protease family protein [Mobilicoccus sp.]|nr:site-2 protease family protein [Mobilicoccus sp.]
MTTVPEGGPSRALRLGAPGGVPVYMSWTWPLFAVLIIWYFAPRIDAALGVGAIVAGIVAAAYAVLLLFSVLVHEAAHALVARATGARVGRIVVDLFGGHTTFENRTLTPARSAAIAVVGPLANGVLALLGWLVLPYVGQGVPWLLAVAFVVTNGLVAVFNLLPGHPLDGGHILDAAVWGATGKRHLGLLASGWAGRGLVVVVVGWLVVWPLAQGQAPSFFLMAWAGLIGALLWSGASQAVRAGRAMGARRRVTMERVLAPAVVVDASWTLGQAAARIEEVRRASGREPVALVDTGGHLGVLLRAEHPGVGPDTPVSALTARLDERWFMTVDGLPPITDVIDRMHATAAPLIVLMTGDHPSGVVTATAVRAAEGDQSAGR